MAGSAFIRTVTYGGYDKADVIRRLDSLYGQISGLENELRETKLLLEGNENGREMKVTIETILAESRAKLTEAQKEKETLSAKLRSAEDTIKKNENEIKKLTASLEEANAKLEKANAKLAAGSGDEKTDLSTVFIEAKKSADMIEKAAKENAEKLRNSADEAAKQSVAFANDEAEKVINDAERKAAEIVADAKNSAGEMEAAYNNMRASIHSEMTSLGVQLNNFKEALTKFEENGIGNLYKCEELLAKTEETLTAGGVPEFSKPEKVSPDYPERPKRKADPDEIDAKKRKSGLEKLRQMAESITAPKEKAEETQAEKKPEPAKTAGNDDKNSGPDSSSAEKGSKSGKTDLAALAEKAKALKNK